MKKAAALLAIAAGLLFSPPSFACRGTVAKPQPDPRPPTEAGLKAFEQGQQLEQSGKIREAMKAYRVSVKEGYGPAAKAMGDLYGKGRPGVPRDYQAALEWWRKAHELGTWAGLHCEYHRETAKSS